MDLPPIGLGCANLFQLDLLGLIDVAGRHGFRRISARPYMFAKALAEGHTEADPRSRHDDAGLEVSMVDGLTKGLPGIPDASTLDPALRATLPPEVVDPPDEVTCFRACVALGAPVLNIAHYMGTPVPLDELAGAIAGICRRAADHGVTIALEFVPGGGVPDLPTAQAVVEATGEPNCGITLDVFHLDRSGGTLEDVRGLPPGIVAGIQISDRTPQSTYVPFGGRMLPGAGSLPLGDLLAAGLLNNPGAPVDIEVLNQELRELPPDETAARLAAAVSAWVAGLGEGG